MNILIHTEGSFPQLFSLAKRPNAVMMVHYSCALHNQSWFWLLVLSYMKLGHNPKEYPQKHLAETPSYSVHSQGVQKSGIIKYPQNPRHQLRSLTARLRLTMCHMNSHSAGDSMPVDDHSTERLRGGIGTNKELKIARTIITDHQDMLFIRRMASDSNIVQTSIYYEETGQGRRDRSDADLPLI